MNQRWVSAAPFVASKLVEQFNATLPFIIGAGALVAAAVVLSTVHGPLAAADRGETVQPESTAVGTK